MINKKHTIATMVFVLLVSMLSATETVYVKSYIVPFDKINKQKEIKKIISDNDKYVPEKTYIIKGKKVDKYFSGKNGVKVYFNKKNTSVKNFNALMDIASEYALKHLKTKNSENISRMLKDLKE